jgi:hypothetical protein
MPDFSIVDFRVIARDHFPRAEALWRHGDAFRFGPDDGMQAMAALWWADFSDQRFAAIGKLAPAPGRSFIVAPDMLRAIWLMPGWMGSSRLPQQSHPLHQAGAALVIAAIAGAPRMRGRIRRQPDGAIEVTLDINAQAAAA